MVFWEIGDDRLRVVLKFIASHVSKTHTADGSLKLKIMMVDVHFVQGGDRNDTPAKNCQPPGKRSNQFSMFLDNEIRRNWETDFFIIIYMMI